MCRVGITMAFVLYGVWCMLLGTYPRNPNGAISRRFALRSRARSDLPDPRLVRVPVMTAETYQKRGPRSVPFRSGLGARVPAERNNLAAEQQPTCPYAVRALV